MTAAGELAVKVTADTSSFMAKTAAQTQAVGSKAGAGFSKAFVGVLGAAAIGGGIAMFLKSSVQAAGAFQQSLNVLQQAAGATGEEMKMLSDLALKMGQDTIYSAGEAATSMLELAKAGLTPAQIEAGALAASMNLAATEGIALADSAVIVANALNTFGLKASQAGEVSDALAGSATASSASVQDMALALSQVGMGAVDAGLSIQETTAALAAFADSGIRGSDAGTSLKTFLARLVPMTETAAGGFKALGLEMTDNQGNFKSLAAMSEELRTGLKGMSDAERTAALNAAFGSDARRAALVLAREGADGLREYVKASSEAGAADKMASARMKGYAGAMESLKGSIETLQIGIGTMLLPAITAVVQALTVMVNWMGDNQEVVLVLAAIIGGALLVAITAYAVAAITAAGATIAAGAAVLAIIAAVVALAAGFIWAYNNVEWFAAGVQLWMKIAAAWFGFLWRAAQSAFNFLKAAFIAVLPYIAQVVAFFVRMGPAFATAGRIIANIAGYVWGAIKTMWSFVSFYLRAIWAVVKFAFNQIKAVVTSVVRFLLPFWRVSWAVMKAIVVPVLQAIWAVIKFAWGVIKSVFQSGMNAIKAVWDRIRDFVNVAREVFGAISEAIADKVNTISEKISGIKDAVVDFFATAGEWLVGAGKAIIQGLIDGIGSMKDAVLDKAKDVMGPLGWVVPGSPVRQGPLAAHGGYHMRWAGQQIGLQLAEGIGSSKGAVQAASASMVGGLATPSSMRLNPGSVVGSDGANQEIRVFIGDRELTDIVRVETVRETARAGAAYRHRRR